MIHFVYTKIKGFSGQNNISLELIRMFKEESIAFEETHLIPFRTKNTVQKIEILFWRYPKLFVRSFRLFLPKKKPVLVICNFQQTFYSMIGFSLSMWPLFFLNKVQWRLYLSLNGSIFYKWNEDDLKNKIFGLWLSRSEKTVVVGPLMSEKLKAKYGLNQAKIVPIDNFTDAYFPNDDWVHLKHEKNEVIDITYLSLFVEKKGFIEFIQAVIQLSKRTWSRGIRINLCGKFIKTEECSEQHTLNRLQSLVHELEAALALNDQFTLRLFVDGIGGAEKRSILEDTHIFVLPTYYANEAQPISLIEAGAFGAALVAGTTGEIPYMFSGDSVLYLDAICPNEIEQKIMELTEQDFRRKSMGISVYREVQSKYTVNSFRNGWKSLIYQGDLH